MIIFYFLFNFIFASNLNVTINDDASWSLTGPNGFKLDSGTYMLHRHGSFYHTQDKSLTVSLVTKKREGTDNIGKYLEHVFKFSTKGKIEKVQNKMTNLLPYSKC